MVKRIVAIGIIVACALSVRADHEAAWNEAMLAVQACKDVVSFGEANKESIALLLSKRGRAIDGKKLTDVKKPEEIEKIASEAESSPKKLEELGVSPVFFLSPPRGGFGKRKAHVPFGPVGKNPNINELISSMA